MCQNPGRRSGQGAPGAVRNNPATRFQRILPWSSFPSSDPFHRLPGKAPDREEATDPFSASQLSAVSLRLAKVKWDRDSDLRGGRNRPGPVWSRGSPAAASSCRRLQSVGPRGSRPPLRPPPPMRPLSRGPSAQCMGLFLLSVI